MLEEVLGVFGKIFEFMTSVQIGSKSFLPIAWMCKIVSQIIEIVLGAIILGTDIVPNLLKIAEGSSAQLEDRESYKKAAHAYIAFFVLEIMLDVAILVWLLYKHPKTISLAYSALYSVFFDMPIMVCGVCLMRAKGTIDWDKETFELLFQIWYIANIMLQITIGSAEKARYFTIIVAPVSYLIACLPYAFVIIPISGWQWFPSPSAYFEDSQKFVHGTFTSSQTNNMFDFLIVSGFVGQWIVNILLFLLLLGIAVKCAKWCIIVNIKYPKITTLISVIIVIATIIIGVTIPRIVIFWGLIFFGINVFLVIVFVILFAYKKCM